MRGNVRGGGVVVGLVVLWMVCASPAGASEAKPFGVANFTIQPTERTVEIDLGKFGAGEAYEFFNEPYHQPFTQAGGHPWALTTNIELDTETTLGKFVAPTRDAKDIVVSLPPGLLGNPTAVPRCPITQITGGSEQPCPTDTQVGVYLVHLSGGHELLAPIVNVTPEAGQSAEFALENTTKTFFIALLTAHLVRNSEGYGIDVIGKEIPRVGLSSAELTFWGVPADHSHDAMRGRICRIATPGEPLKCQGGFAVAGLSPVPFLSLPTGCSSGPETVNLRADSWQEPGSIGVNGRYTGYVEEHAKLSGATGCDLLSFNPGTGIVVEPDTLLADEPVGLGVNLDVPQNEKPTTNVTPVLRNTVLTLPEGMSVSPGVVDGIQACNEFGPEGINITGPESEEVGLDEELQLAPGHCPDASIVGTAEVITPLLPSPVKGHVYLARPGCGGPGQSACTEQDALDGNLYKLYFEVGGTGALGKAGVEFKVPFQTEANPATGQLTTNVSELVQAPYSEVKVHLNGGPRAPISNPGVCGPAVTTADFTPWSAPGITPEGLAMPGTPDESSSSFFEVAGCPNPPLFAPGFLAGTVTPQAGQFSSFTMNIARQDREQYVKGIQVHTPPGLLGMLSSVQLCGEPEADNGHCLPSSKIGTTRVATGAGSHPFEIEGNVYLTGPYEGAPFGLSVVVNVVAGPFNLGLKIVRARIAVDPENSTLTVTTDETGPYAVPQIIFGVPVRLKRVTVNIDRRNFMFNPTNCNPQQIIANLSGSQNATASLSSPFAVGGCKSLAFKPKFTVSTNAHTSRVKGASLDAKLSYPAGSIGNEANIARVKVSLPRQLPSRLTTLQKACPDATFNKNPAECPEASVVGVAKATTPLLPVELAGPVYFVSHGGEAFPSLIIVLQGDGVRVDLTGTTFINKAGITSTTFKTVPDVPVGSFELYLPQGKYSALAANGNLCKSQGKLKMPTEFQAQNGEVLKQNTQIKTTGCTTTKTRRVKNRKRGTHR